MSTPKPTTADLVQRIDLLEHALHETRQRLDMASDAVWALSARLAWELWPSVDRAGHADPDKDLDVIKDERYDAWASIGLERVYELFDARDLERHHFEGMEPEFIGHPDHPDGPAPEGAALLAGARERHRITGGIAGSLTVSKDRT